MGAEDVRRGADARVVGVEHEQISTMKRIEDEIGKTRRLLLKMLDEPRMVWGAS